MQQAFEFPPRCGSGAERLSASAVWLGKPTCARHQRVRLSVGISALTIACLSCIAIADDDSNQDLVRMQGAFRLEHRGPREAAWLGKARSFINLDDMSGIEPLFGGNRTASAVEPSHPHGVFDDPFACVITPARAGLAALQNEYGIRSDIYEALLFQAASDTLPDRRTSAGTARFNARFDLLLFRNAGEGIGKFTAQFRQNNQFPPGEANLSDSVASPVNLNELASGIDTKLCRCLYAQSACDDRVMLTVGKLNPNDYVALNLFASDETTQYLAQQFDGNDVLPSGYQNYSEALALQALPSDWFYCNAVLVGNDRTAEAGMDFSFDDGVTVAAEAGVIYEWLGKPGRVSFAWCGSNGVQDAQTDPSGAGPWGNAYAFIAQYFVTTDVGVWFQWAWGERHIVSTSTNEGGVGITIENAFGRKGDGFGVGAGWSTPLDETLSTQGLLETYYRMQVTSSLQLSLDMQMLMPTTTSELSEPTLLGALRAVIRF